MVMSVDSFVGRLVVEVPEAEPLLAEHLDEDDELLLHPLMYGLVLLCEEAWSTGARDLLQRCLRLLDDALLQGDEYVNNAVAVSFVEDSSWYEPGNQDYIATWPSGLLAEVELQRAEWAKRGGGV